MCACTHCLISLKAQPPRALLASSGPSASSTTQTAGFKCHAIMLLDNGTPSDLMLCTDCVQCHLASRPGSTANLEYAPALSREVAPCQQRPQLHRPTRSQRRFQHTYHVPCTECRHRRCHRSSSSSTSRLLVSEPMGSSNRSLHTLRRLLQVHPITRLLSCACAKVPRVDCRKTRLSGFLMVDYALFDTMQSRIQRS